MLTNLTYQHDLKVISEKTNSFLKKLPSLKINVALHLPYKDTRSKVEHFIWNGFKQYYQADIQHFLPNLISIGVGNNIKSALGFRSAKVQALFLEQYLEYDIASYFIDEDIQRQQIAEIGNLFGTHRQMTLQLFIITLAALAKSGFKKLVFSATPQVKAMFDKFTVKMHHIGRADPAKIGAQLQQWGNYYESIPEVFSINIDEVSSIIKHSKRLSIITSKFSEDVNSIASQLVK